LFSAQLMAKSVTLKAEVSGRTDVKVHLPRGFKKQEKWPLIISMHGFGGNANIQKYYVRLRAFNNKFGFVDDVAYI
jgi:poly(3-hydroxybutyrate) depolymerase